jgi:hypothetical protein
MKQVANPSVQTAGIEIKIFVMAFLDLPPTGLLIQTSDQVKPVVE